MKKLTKAKLKKHKPCAAGFKWWHKNCKGLQTNVQILKLIDYCTEWANWLICRLLNKTNKIKYAIYAAKRVDKYHSNNHPQNAIIAAENYLKHPNNNRANAAYSAYAAALAAANEANMTNAANAAFAAAFAAYAAYASNEANASNDANAAYADIVAYAAGSAASYAAFAAANTTNEKLKAEIIKNGIKLLNKQ